MKRSAVAKSAPTTASADAAPAQSHGETHASRPGLPLFLQTKCACGGSCSKCATRAEDDRLQKKAEGRAVGGQPATLHAVARGGVETAHEPLPHLNRIQSSFGSRDLRGIKAQVGGSAADANDHMGALGYTVGDRIGFRSSPDVRLAAHEATHVIQQRDGVQLEDGVGHPGDAYEQQADAVAEAVARGESAEPILDRGPAIGFASPSGVAASPVGVAVQHQLSINATRLFEPDAAAAEAPPGAARDQGAGAAGAGGEVAAAADGETATTDDREPDGGEDAGDTPAAAGSAPAPGGGGGTATSAGTGGGCAGGGQARCYDAPSDQPANEPEEQPPNPEGTQVQEETSDEGEEDLPEPDDCPPPSAVAAQADAAAPATSAPEAGSAAASGGAAPGAASEGAEPAAAGAAGTEGEAGGSAGGEGGGAGAPAAQGAGSEGGGSPMDGAIAAVESQRDAAVGSYSDSSAMLASASDGNSALRGRTAFAGAPGETAMLAIQRDDASQRATRFFSDAADQIDQAIAFVSQQVPEQLGAQAESAKAELAASIEEQKGSISARIDAARSQARADAAVAREQVGLQADAFVADVESETAGAIDSLTAAHADATARVAEVETATLDEINRIYADGRTDLSGLGETIGGEATATGETFAATYRGFRHCTENGFWDGDLSERRSEAQEKAARSTAKGYHDRIVESAHKRAREITKAGRKEDRCTVIGAATTARDTLDSQLTQLVTALEGARDQSILQAGTTRDSLIASIDDSLSTTLRHLNQQEHDQRQAADDTGYLQQALQEQIAHAGAAALLRVVANAATTLQSSLGQVQALFARSQAPDPAALDQAMADVEPRVSSAIGDLRTGIEGGLALAVEQLAAAAQDGLGSLAQVTESNDQSAAALSGGFSTSMATIAGTDNFAAQRSALTQLMQQSADSGAAGLNQVADALAESCDGTITGAEGKLTQAHTSLEQNLRQSKQDIECDITSKADQAASEEAPAWKRLIAVLLIIIVIIIVIVVIVATAGGALAGLAAAVGPIAAAAIAGAVVGAVTSALITIATDLWGNRALSASRIAKAALVGAITGAIGGAAGAWIGGALQGFSLVVQYGAAMALAGGLDVVTQFVMGGLSFEHFSWSNLGLTLLITALTLGLAHGVGGGPHPTSTPGEGGATPVPESLGPTAPAEPTPTVAPEPTAPRSVPEPTPSPVPEPTAPAAAPEPTPATAPEPTAPAPAPEPTPTAAPEPSATTTAPAPEPTTPPTTTPEPTATAAPPEASAPPKPARMGTVSAGPEGIVEHPTSSPVVEQAPPRRVGAAAPEPAAPTPEPAVTEPIEPTGSTSEDIADVRAAEESRGQPGSESDFEAHADDVRDQMNPRTSESTTGPERAQAAAEAAERAPVPPEDDVVTVPDEVPEGGLFEDPNALPGTPEYYRRPTGYPEGMRENVWRAAEGPDGVVRDPLTERPMNPNEPWHMGHKPGQEFWRLQRSAMERGISREQFRQEYFNEEHFRPELPESNVSHAGESQEPYEGL